MADPAMEKKDFCPGSANIRTPELSLKKCPSCGADIEMFSNETSTNCTACGFTVYNDINSCIRWCRFAEKCVGEDVVKNFKSSGN
jgi:ribosomal protein S27AE